MPCLLARGSKNQNTMLQSCWRPDDSSETLTGENGVSTETSAVLFVCLSVHFLLPVCLTVSGGWTTCIKLLR